jgi:hypothetical protein
VYIEPASLHDFAPYISCILIKTAFPLFLDCFLLAVVFLFICCFLRDTPKVSIDIRYLAIFLGRSELRDGIGLVCNITLFLCG